MLGVTMAVPVLDGLAPVGNLLHVLAVFSLGVVRGEAEVRKVDQIDNAKAGHERPHGRAREVLDLQGYGVRTRTGDGT